MKFPGIRTVTLKFEFLNNSINIDKFPKMFMTKTNRIIQEKIYINDDILK